MMTISLHTITIRKLVDGYEDNKEEGVVGYGGQLNIRPAYQREFVYNLDKQRAVIDSIFKNFPLNVMYWVKIDDNRFEVLDGQQRTLSICEYYSKNFDVSVDGDNRFFHNLTQEQRSAFLDYQLQVYICENGTDTERLEWFKIINIAGLVLKEQELRNANYTGKWLSSAKLTFSKRKCYAFNYGGRYMQGEIARQDYLETVLTWACDKDKVKLIRTYMAKHQFDDDAEPLKQYFTDIIDWVESVFPDYSKKMQGLPWGIYYNKYKGNKYDKDKVGKRVKELMNDVEVTKYAGIYEYILGGEKDERLLSLRSFDEPTKRLKYKEQDGKCAICGKPFAYEDMQGDHIIPWSKGGTTIANNCQMLCVNCNLAKSNH